MLNILEGNKILQTLFLVIFALLVISFVRMSNEEKELFDSVNDLEEFQNRNYEYFEGDEELDGPAEGFEGDEDEDEDEEEDKEDKQIKKDEEEQEDEEEENIEEGFEGDKAESFYGDYGFPENFQSNVEGFHGVTKDPDAHLKKGNCSIGQWSSWDEGKKKCTPCIWGLCENGYFKRPAGNQVDYCKPMKPAQCKANQAADLSCNTACEPCNLPKHAVRIGNAATDLKGTVPTGGHSNIGKSCYFRCDSGYILAGKDANKKKCLKKPIMCNTNLYIKSRYGTGSYLEICGFRVKGCTSFGKNTVYDVKTNKSKTKLLRGWNQRYDRNCRDHWYWGRWWWGCKRWRYRYCRWHWWVRRVCRKSCGLCRNYPKFQVGTKGGNIWKLILKDSVTRPASYRWRVKKDKEELGNYNGINGIPLRYGDQVYIQNQLATKKTYLDVCSRDFYCQSSRALAVQTWTTPNRHPQSTGSSGLWVVLKAPHTGGPIVSDGEFVTEGDPIYLQNTYRWSGRKTYLDVCGSGKENCRDCQYGVISHLSHNRANVKPSTASWTLLNA